MHHVLMVRGSSPNTSDRRRIGVATRYMPTRIRQLAPHPDTATLVNGDDIFGHFELERRSLSNMDPAELAYSQTIVARHTAIPYDGVGAAGAPESDVDRLPELRAIMKRHQAIAAL